MYGIGSDKFTLKPAGKPMAVVKDGRRKLHQTFEGGVELVEEYDLRTDELVVRKWRRPTPLGGEGPWDYEVGEAPTRFNPDADLLAPSSENPVMIRKDSDDAFQWRIRNLPYPKDTYQVTVDTQNDTIVVRTTNRKYFKRFDVPDLKRLNLSLSADELTWTYANNTLVISYEKPSEAVECEREFERVRQNMKAEKPEREGDVQCPTQ
eukprot:EC796990.1.p2 GENE.EC796990.1~~EC796990.1.p2  ORF type:complete len:207 (+),score=72.15 EC796990.1:39-659(+)